MRMKIAKFTKKGSLYTVIAASMLSFYPTFAAFANQENSTTTNVINQKIQISGIVRDENGDPVPGASIQIRNSQSGTITDMDGRFSLYAETGQSVIVSFIGYNDFTFQVDGKRTTFNIELTPATQLLDEVIVTGYQTISKERATGSFAIVTPKDMEGKLQTNILSRMEGKIAGLDVRKSADNVNGVPTIRGISTLTNSKRTPLYVSRWYPL